MPSLPRADYARVCDRIRAAVPRMIAVDTAKQSDSGSATAPQS